MSCRQAPGQPSGPSEADGAEVDAPGPGSVLRELQQLVDDPSEGGDRPATPPTQTFTLDDPDPTGDTSERPLSPFCFVESIRQMRAVSVIETVRQKLGARSPVDGAYSMADALKYAVLYGHTGYSAWLLREHAGEALAAPVCCPLLLTAVRLDRADVVEQLCRLSRQVVSAQPYVDSRGCAAMEGRRTALHVAAEMSSVTIAVTLLRYGANPMAKDQFGMSPLDRILHTLPGPHINFNTVRLARELLKCIPVLQASTQQAWVLLAGRNPNWSARLHPDCRALSPGPFSLMQMSRIQVRKAIGYPRLPEAAVQLPIPPMMQRFINLEW